MNTKLCSKCQQKLPISAFNTNCRRSDGLQSSCKQCRAKYNKAHYQLHASTYKIHARANREKALQWLQTYKVDKKCCRCPENHPACLQFHHLDPAHKEINISQACHAGWSIERIQREIDKCIILCANCHCKEHND